MKEENKQQSLSEFQIALRSFKANRFAYFCVIILSALYFSAISRSSIGR